MPQYTYMVGDVVIQDSDGSIYTIQAINSDGVEVCTALILSDHQGNVSLKNLELTASMTEDIKHELIEDMLNQVKNSPTVGLTSF